MFIGDNTKYESNQSAVVVNLPEIEAEESWVPKNVMEFWIF